MENKIEWNKLEELFERNPSKHKPEDAQILTTFLSNKDILTDEISLNLRKQILNQLYKTMSILNGELDPQYALTLVTLLRIVAKEGQGFGKELVDFNQILERPPLLRCDDKPS